MVFCPRKKKKKTSARCEINRDSTKRVNHEVSGMLDRRYSDPKPDTMCLRSKASDLAIVTVLLGRSDLHSLSLCPPLNADGY